MWSGYRPYLALLTVNVLLCSPVFAFQTPLSDEAVREAYFLGQRRDESMAHFLNAHTRFLPLPESGPHIYAITFLTPYALLVQYSSRQPNYSAQQAEREHHPDEEVVRIEVGVALTQSYGPFLTRPTGSRSGSPIGLEFRSFDFWKDFDIAVFDGEKRLHSTNVTGEPTYLCDDGCILTGATIRLQFPAEVFTSDSATVKIIPPEGEPVSVNFDLSSLR